MSATNRANARSQNTGNDSTRWVGMLAVCFLAATLTTCNSGCVTFMANMVKVIKGTDSPAEFDKLKEKKVAVIVSTPAGLNKDASGIIMSTYVHTLLATHVHKVKMVNQDEVTRIINDMPASQSDLSMIGSRLSADYIVAINISNLKLKDGQTLYKGSSTTDVSVYEVANGSSPVFRKSLPDFVFPQTGVSITDTDEATFQRFYLAEVARRLARVFYPYDPSVDVAADASSASLDSMQH